VLGPLALLATWQVWFQLVHLRAIGAVGWSIQGTVKSTWLPAELMQIWYHDKDYWVC